MTPRSTRLARHKRIFFSRAYSFLVDLKSFLFVLPKILKRRKKDILFPPFLAYEEIPKDSISRFLKHSVATGAALLIITSIAPSTLLETGVSADILGLDADYFANEVLDEEETVLPESEDGFFMKMNPQGEDISRIGYTDKVKHIVERGETLSEIAQRYGLKADTIVWENNLTEENRLSVGQTLIIPPVDGVSHAVSGKSETLNKIAKQYGVDVQLIQAHNKLDGDVIQKGQVLFIPGGKPLATERAIARSTGRSTRVAYDTFEPKAGEYGSAETPSTGKRLIFPSVGRISRGFSGGHAGVDIGNTSKPDIWAADVGKVILADGGCPTRDEERLMGCNHGYGNTVVIDHGDGLQTRYGHCETLYVTAGQQVEQGQLICRMGNSGRVFGPTGIHLHFEVIDNGVKRNPAKYY